MLPMLNKLILGLIISFLLKSNLIAQTWDLNAITSSYVSLKHENGKYGLLRELGDGTKDSIQSIYDCIYKFTDYLMKPGYVGKMDSSWYLLDFDKPAFLIPAQKYLGHGFFLTTLGKAFSLYSVKERRFIMDNIWQYNTYLQDSLVMDNTTKEISFYSFNKSNTYTQLFDNDLFWVKNRNGLTYWLSPYGYFYIKNNLCFKKKVNNKSLYGLKIIMSEAEKQIIPPIYDTIFDYGQITFARKGKKYDAYNTLIEKIASNLDDYFYYIGDDCLMNNRINGKVGIITISGKEILNPIFDSVWIDKLIIATKNDSIFFYEVNKLVKSLPKTRTSTYKITGSYELLPFYISSNTNGKEKIEIIYNFYSNQLLDASAYEEIYPFGIRNGNYLFTAKKNGKYGIINLKNEIIHAFEYDYISQSLVEGFWFENRFFIVTKNGKSGIINNLMKEIVPIEFNNIDSSIATNRMIPTHFTAKKENLTYLINWDSKTQSKLGYDTIQITKKYDYYSKNNEKLVSITATKDGEIFFIDSTGKKYFDFTNIEIKEHGEHFTLEETKLNKNSINITPLATINSVEDFNQEHSYAIVFCLNRYFVINKYGEMSAGFEKMIELYDYKNNLIFGSKFKKDKANGLYDFNGNEIGKLSKYRLVDLHEEKISHSKYFIFEDSKGKKGLANAKGELLLECKYNGLYPNEKANFDVYLDQDEDLINIDPLTLKPLPWSK